MYSCTQLKIEDRGDYKKLTVYIYSLLFVRLLEMETICMEYCTFKTIRDYMIEKKLKVFQCCMKVYIYDTDKDSLQCFLNNVEHQIKCTQEIQDLKSIKKSMEQIVKPITKEFDKFINDCFKKDSIDKTIDHSTVFDVWKQWKKTNCPTLKFKKVEVIALMKDHFESTLNKFIGISYVDPSDPLMKELIDIPLMNGLIDIPLMNGLIDIP